MTDITAAEYRTAEKVARSLGFVTAQSCADHAARLESEGAVPAGGMALTAEQVEDMRAAREALRGYRNFDVYARSHVNRLIEAVDALFPATEPAEQRCRKWTVRVAGGIETGIQCVLPAGHECFHDYVHPISAEPAEEETKAEAFESDLDMHPDAVYGREYVEQAKARRIARAVEECETPASSPVVPAPTETEWQTCGHVPIGIVFRSKDRHPAFTWVNEGGSLLSVRNECEDGHFSDGEHCLPSMVDENFAPFVAAEEG